MNPRLHDYLIPIGKLTIAAAFLEEVVIRWGALLSEGGHHETHAKRLLRGLDKNLDFLIERAKEHISPAGQKPVLDLIETARALKNKRNENVHGVWAEMVAADTGAFAKVARSRYEKDATGKLIWDLRTPNLSELEQLATALNKNARNLNECLANLWDIDDQLRYWRAEHGF